MIFFRQNLQEVITLPSPPVEDLEEAYEVEGRTGSPARHEQNER